MRKRDKSVPEMKIAVRLAAVLFLVLWGVLLTLRLRLERARASLDELQLAAEDAWEGQ